MDHRGKGQAVEGYAVEVLRDYAGHRVWERQKVVASHDEALVEAASVKDLRDCVAARIMRYRTGTGSGRLV